MTQRFVAPPTWPQPPVGWTPPEGWQPDPAWGPAPEGWQFWQDATENDGAGRAPGLARTIVVTVLFGLFGLIPAYLDAQKATRRGLPGGRYWVAFGAGLGGSVALYAVTAVAVVAALVHSAGDPVADAGEPVGGPVAGAAGGPIGGVFGSEGPAAQPTDTPGSCTWAPDQSGNPAVVDAGTPPATVPTSGTVTLTMTTNFGAVPMMLDAAQAPCATASFTYLARQGFFDGTTCHRETSAQGLQVLQCGDPSGTGTGGPAYQYPTHTVGTETYPRGTVAMANSGQGFDGSQFFLVYGDSELSPDYTVVGTVGSAGLAVLDRIAANGNDGSNGIGDGAPSAPVEVQTISTR